ncbi:MAG: two-component system response regulator [Pseudomonadota bacterium]
MTTNRPTLLLVDDTPVNIDVLRAALEDHYDLKVALNGERALSIAAADPAPDLVLLDIMMPGMDGYEVCRRLKAAERTRRVPVIFVTALNDTEDETQGFAVGAVDYITKPVSPPVVQARVATHLKLYDQERHLEALVRLRTRDLDRTRLEIIRRLGRAAEYKDDETGLHVIRMSHYARLLAKASGMSEDAADIIFHAAPLHDIGKIGMPDRLLQKTDDLTSEEWKIMRTHPVVGAGIIGKHENELLDTARIVALTHHEKWDGSGYPRGLKGEQIPLAGRIVAIADVFDALTSERPYKGAWTVDAAVTYLKKESGAHFDPTLIECFLSHLPEIQRIQDQYSELPMTAFD